MAQEKKFNYKVEVDTKGAVDNLKKASAQVNASGKSIAELTKLLRQQMEVFKELTAEQRDSELGQSLQKNIVDIQSELKKANAGIKTFAEQSEESISNVGEVIREEFNADRIIEGLDKLKSITNFESLEEGFDNVADAIGSLDPRLKLVAEVGKVAFQEILKEITLTDGGAKKLAGTFGGLKEALSFRNILSLSNPITALANAKKIADDYRKGELIAQRKFELERENVILEANGKILQAQAEKNKKIAEDNNRSFEEQKNALVAARDLELKNSAQQELIARNQLEIFLNQKNIRELRERQGANFIKNLNADQLKEYTELQAQIAEQAEVRAGVVAEFEKDLTERIREERERQLSLYKLQKQREIDANEFALQNEATTLAQSVELAKKTAKAKIDALNAELAVLDKNNKFDEVRAVEIANEKIGIERDLKKQIDDLNAEYTQREIALQEAKNAAIISINEKYNELFKGTLDEQIARINDNKDLQLEINQRKIQALDEQDKDYYLKLEQLEQERQKIIDDTNAKIVQQTLAFYDAELNNIASKLDIFAAQRSARLTTLQSDFAETQAEISKKISETEDLSKNLFAFIRSIPELKKQYTDLYQTRVQQLQEQATREKELNDKQIQYNAAQIDRLKKELELNAQISEIRKQEIKNQIALLEAQTKELQSKQTSIDVKLKIDVEGAKKDLDSSIKGISEKVAQAIDQTIQKINEAFKTVADFGNAVIDLQLQQQINLIEAEEERVDKTIELNEKLLEDLNKREQKATGARARRLRKQIQEQERAIEQEKQRKEELEAQKVEAERQANEKRKIFQIGQVIIDTAAGVAKAVAQFPETFGLPFSAFVAATGALQIATIESQKFARGGIAYEGGYIPADGGMIEGRPHSLGGVKFYMRGGRVGEADGVKGEAYIVNTRHNPMLKKLASDLNVAGGGKAFFAQGGSINSLVPSALGLQQANPMQEFSKDIIDAINQEKVVLPVNIATEAMQNYLAQTKRKKI